ncbi:MAG: hypothetical protein KBA64_08005 [Armatimonadetes bacterium]|jgi:hypothetical protein|nr:hypothetical protein [Armatimonadota bacterium]MDI9601438.1 hypothetical protein [Acidobacteriota bacterium]NLN90464.1 hypothetical protein [candidate division WS1 bacterium]
MARVTRDWVLGLAAAGFLVLAAGCVPVGLVGTTVSDVSVTPASMAYGGGQATVTAYIEGSGKVSGIAGYPDDRADAISMTPASPGSRLYRGTVPIRPNVTTEPMTVLIVVRVLDSHTNDLLDYGHTDLTVGAAPSLPPAPPTL